MLTQTSVYTKSAPRTPACTSSVTVTRAPLCSAAAWGGADDVGRRGQRGRRGDPHVHAQ